MHLVCLGSVCTSHGPRQVDPACFFSSTSSPQALTPQTTVLHHLHTVLANAIPCLVVGLVSCPGSCTRQRTFHSSLSGRRYGSSTAFACGSLHIRCRSSFARAHAVPAPSGSRWAPCFPLEGVFFVPPLGLATLRGLSVWHPPSFLWCWRTNGIPASAHRSFFFRFQTLYPIR